MNPVRNSQSIVGGIKSKGNVMKITKISNGVKKIILIILGLVTLIIPGLILADNNTTISYLKGQNQNAWISQALAAATVESVDISYLDYQTTDLMTASKNILVLAAVRSQDKAQISQLVEVVRTSKNNGQFGSADLLNDDFWAILALASVKELDDTQDVKNFIIAHQNSDGGFSWSKDGASDSNDTAAAMMALLDLGLNSSSSEMVKALDYLKSVQNDDGGFAYDANSLSDGASTAWILAALNKVGTSASTWQKNNNNPVAFLENLRQDDGSFLWMVSDQNGSSMVTAYALLALSGKSYPVSYIDIAPEEEPISGHSLRIEGPEGTICLADNLAAPTVMGILVAGSEVCGYDYVVENSSYGAYISSIGGVASAGMNGWQYFVDFKAGMVAAGDYILEDNDEVLWAYGGWPFSAVRLTVSDTHFEVGENLIATFHYFDGNNWLPLTGAEVVFGAETYQTDGSGQLNLPLNQAGAYAIFSESTDHYSRSNREYIMVGDGVSQTVDLLVNIKGNTPGGGDTIAFNVDKSNINFGELKAGQSADTIVSITNIGSTDIYLEASVLGDQVFQNFVDLNQHDWSDYNLSLGTAASQPVNVSLAIPVGFVGSGQKAGQLIFWGINQ